MAEKQQNQIVVLEPVTKTVNELLEMITERDQAEIMPFMNADEAVQCARQFTPCMFVVCIQTANDIPNVLNILKKMKSDIKSGVVKTLLVSKVKNSQLQKLIGEFGVTDYIEEPIPARSLQFKANLQLRAIDNVRKQLEMKKLADEKIVFKTSAKPEDDAAQTVNGEVKPRNKPALALANDTFLIKNSQVKKQAKKFVVELDGPDPSTGEWVNDGEDPETKAAKWRWKPHDPEDEPGSDDGDGWVATGDKPQFKPANKKWQLSSEKPSLFYKKKNAKIAEKISTDENGEIVMAEDSPAAEENLRKNLAKVERIKKRKAAEAAGLPPPEENTPEERAAPPAPASEEEEASGPEAILKAIRKKKAAGGTGKGVADEEEPEETAVSGTESTEDDGGAARKKLEALRKARRERKAAGLPEFPEEPITDDAKTTGVTAAPETVEEESDPLNPIKVKKREKAKRPLADGHVLDFLEKKKNAAAKALAPLDKIEGEDAESTPPPDEAAEEEASGPAALKKRGRKKSAKGKLPGEIGAEEELFEEPEEEIPAAEAEPEALTGLKAPVVTETEDGQNIDELIRQAKERRRRREENKRKLLEEIQVEEDSGETQEELELFEREKKRRKAEGLSEEEETDADKERQERLEKLRRHRDALASLEREQLEDDQQGEHLHTAMAEQLKGMNVWDTDEEAPADEGPAEKRLRKLKKERAEREAAEKARKESEEAGDLPDFGELDREKKKKAGKGSGTQAEGLEDAFAEEEHGREKSDFIDEEVSEEGAETGESMSDKLARLRKQRDERNAKFAEGLGGDSDDRPMADGKHETAAGSLDHEQSRQAAEEISLDLGAPKLEPKTQTTEDLLGEKSKTSDSMRKFLERRKQRKEAQAAEDVAHAKAKAAEDGSAAPEEKRSFLGIFVAVSDSFGGASEKRMVNILRSLEGSLGNCQAFFAHPREGDQRFKVILGNSVDKSAEFPAENCLVEDLTEPGGALMGHLVLRMTESRQEFAKDESEAIQRAMLTLRPLAIQWLTAKSEKAA